jgi:two-component system phosphate regulon sensor histidine kinase PhoR
MRESVFLACGVSIGIGVAWFSLRSALRRRVATSERRATDAEHALQRANRTSAGDRRVQDVILSSMEEGVLLFDPHGGRVFANQALDRHLGATPESTDVLLPLDLQRAVKRAGYVGDVVRAEVETGTPSRWLRGTALPVGDDGSVLLVIRDVTDARRLDAVRRDFVANASHELKTPVASIRAAAETLRDGAIDDPPAAHRFTEQLEREALRLSRIVSDLLDLSRLESGSDLGEQVRVDAVVSEEVHRMEDEAVAAGVALTLEADAVASISGSARDIALLARNLIDNAIRYTPVGGSVTVEVVADDEGVLLRVADTGLGIPQRDLPRIFERFYRVDRARSRETGGTGLGLAIVRHVAENHGGTVLVSSELGRGTTFEVRIPAAATPTAVDAS